MQIKAILGFLCGLCATSAMAFSSQTVAADNVQARLVSEVGSVSPGRPFWVALEFDIGDGWHTYWRNPGDSGLAPRIAWTLPFGASAGEIVWAAPHRFELPPLVNYGYAMHAVHLIKITPPKDPGNEFSIHAKANWLVCADICIPEEGEFDLALPRGTGSSDPSATALFTRARSEVPQPGFAGATARLGKDIAQIDFGGAWAAPLAAAESLEFFPIESGVVATSQPSDLHRGAAGSSLSLKLSGTPPSGNTLQGILIAHGRADAGEQAPIALELTAPIEPGAPLGSATAAAAPALSAASFASYVLLAILGGLILNLMPCVFPVLSIKALGLVEQAKKHPGIVRRKGLAFAAGVIGSMLSLAAILLALRAGGEQIGWGFQLQSPLFVTMMAYLLFAVGFNLSGVYEVGGSLAGAGDRLTQGDGYRASFFTGVLTTLVATPCTAPFMGAAVGAALSQPAIVALAIFVALGLGLSLPYLLISFAPWLRKALPRPGAWMDTLKQIFAFPMYASAAWLLWVLAQQTSPGFFAAALAGAVLIGFAAWAYQKSSVASGGNRWLALGVAAMALLIAIGLPLQLASGAAARAAAARPSRDDQDWRAFDAKELAAMVAAGQPVLVNFTADWCLTCLVNERNAFGDATVKALFQSKGVTLVKGDWTSRNPEITAALAKFGRAGVPLYVLYNSTSGESEPTVLPQLLTPGVVADALARLPDRRTSPLSASAH